MIGEEPPFERRRMTILMLPNELILSCLARVSRLYYPTLSLASKRFRLLLASKELYQIRTLLGCAETCLYVCLQLHNDRRLRWFTLCRRPNSPRNILVPISSTDVPFESSSDVAMVGPNIYIIGGLVNKKVSSSVKVIDCRSHTLHEAPSMQVARVFPSACVLGEKIYVVGGCKNIDSMNWMEVFDTKTQTWEFLQTSPNQELCRGFKYNSFGYEGTVYVRSKDKGLVAYKLYKGRWRAIDLPMNLGWSLSFSCCVIDNVFYRYNGRTIDWYDHKERSWKTLKGLERLPRIRGNVKLVDYGGKMMVLCKEYVSEETPIWCTAITLERRREGEILGTPEWFDVVYTSNMEYNLVHALATFI